MIVLERTGVVAGEPSRQIMALFGAGLIGCSILAGLAGIAKYAQKHFPFSWQNAGERQQHANEIERYIAELAGTEGVPCVVSVIWAAGRAGFLSTSPEILEELSAFRDVLAFADRLGSRLSSARHMFHLTSSAGGLFEGQRLVDQDSKPEPRRPYGELKLGQERLLAESTSQIAKFVYRPSSVYGSAGEGLRLGLVGVLVANAIRHGVSHIFGAPDTLRDYVFAADVGRFIAQQLNRPTDRSQVFLLTSGKPSSTFEIMRRVEQILGRRLYARFDTRPSVIEHNSYRPLARPDNWHSVSLDTGIFLTTMKIKETLIRADAVTLATRGA